ncbi:hypothetical protein BC938DRAFT_480793 [Jimgerdemannia flammicorona]|uniref:Uncharacterized protein n=1 Tax=Jimgerdemannia flammicorona TaxID=994334 RepID=A0A433QHK3_9FUNG|nr:hypothetical protein BC938DRAFT_480793 [Jimgerdemannia flammicorona]
MNLTLHGSTDRQSETSDDGSEEGELVNDFEVIESISKTSLHDDRFYAVKEEVCVSLPRNLISEPIPPPDPETSNLPLVVQQLSSALTSCKATSANSPLRPCTIIAIRGTPSQV